MKLAQWALDHGVNSVPMYSIEVETSGIFMHTKQQELHNSNL